MDMDLNRAIKRLILDLTGSMLRMEHTYLPKRTDTASAQRSACCHTNGPHEVCSACRGKQLAGLTRFVGHSLEQPARSDMERRFGFDFSKVRIHSDGEAGRAVSSLK